MKYLLTPLQYLKGVGEKRASVLSKLGCIRYVDLLFHLPKNYRDISKISNIKELRDGDIATLQLEVVKISASGSSRFGTSGSGALKVQTLYEDLPVELIYFRGQSYMKNKFKIGAKIIVSGKININFRTKVFGQKYQMPHPDYVLPVSKIDEIPLIEPIYPLTAGLANKYLSALIKQILQKVSIFSEKMEWLNAEYLQKNNWPKFYDALKMLHLPENINVECTENARARLAFDESLAHILSMRMIKFMHQRLNYRRKEIKSSLLDDIKKEDNLIHYPSDSENVSRETFSKLVKQCINVLSFELTNAQVRVLSEIFEDLKKNYPMQRLIQGDVGSGKTIVAFLASLFVVEQKGQVAIVAPTEVLAKQHFKNLSIFAEKLNIKTELLVSATPNSYKKRIKNLLKNSCDEGKDILKQGKTDKISCKNLREERIDIIIGTHAILQNDVEFGNLKLVVFDEQHKFGVTQRNTLIQKGRGVGYLMMSATPIPRTLSLISYADKDLSILDEKPKNRQEVETFSISENKIGELIIKMQKIIEKGEKIFWICPLVDESEKSELIDVHSRFERLNKAYPQKVGIIHGKMNPSQKDEVMMKLILGEINILVATTVIEVGVDVPDATLMIIENCERYGLSQLHQLRGRIGRSELKGTCILIHKKKIGHIAKERIKVMKESADGFYISNQDLILRGHGDLTGLKQSGVPDFKIYNVLEDQVILQKALDFANTISIKELCDRNDAGDSSFLYNSHSSIKSSYNNSFSSIKSNREAENYREKLLHMINFYKPNFAKEMGELADKT